ncbi:amidase [Microbacterium sp. NPDC003461]
MSTTSPSGGRMPTVAERTAGALRAARSSAAEINAFVQVLDDRAARAAEASDLRHAAGMPLGPLDGVAYAVKDNIFVADVPCTWGSRRWDGHRPASSDLCVERMEAAGAVLIGTTNTPELAVGQTTSNALHGTTRNPHDTRLTPGGSSGGSAAAVAAGIVPVALGTDAGGSSRAPASLVGVYGLKTATGTVPRAYGLPQLVPGFQSIGVLAGSVDGLRETLAVLSGPDARDPSSLRRGQQPASRPIRVGWFSAVAEVRCDPQVADRLSAATGILRDRGALVSAIAAPYRWPRLREAWDTLSAVGIRAALDEAPEADAPVDDALAAAAARAAEVSGADYRAAADAVSSLRATAETALQDFDLVLCPVTLSGAWPIDAAPAFSDGSPIDPADLGAFTHWVNALGLAALSIPAPALDDGRPVGIQLVAVTGGEPLLLEVAELLLAGGFGPSGPERAGTETRTIGKGWEL